ncbi:MAG: 7-cyano-7-deazaguanine synthase QueC, partial [Thermoplasmata archaeon]|nr:7-cyano-7-deazaguanine synthase QueC [Thermoplasmata archaeon]
MGKKAVILLSGGLDSATTLALAAEAGYECYALSFDYGQRHLRELESAERLAEHYQVREHKIIPLELPGALQSALTNPEIELIEGRAPEEMRDIPTSYVPARNTIMLSFALGYAEVIGADCIFIGVNSLDYSGYPDCRPEYIEAFQGLANLATRQAVEGRPVRIEAPLLHLTKAEIIRKGMEIGVPYELTWSCYRGGRKAGGSEASDGRLSPKGSIRH